MVLGFAKWVATKGGKKVAETITSLKGKYNIGSADKIKAKTTKTKTKVKHFYAPKDFLK